MHPLLVIFAVASYLIYVSLTPTGGTSDTASLKGTGSSSTQGSFPAGAQQQKPPPPVALVAASQKSLPLLWQKVVFVLWTRQKDSIGYSGTPPHNQQHCHHPPPFGEQCTNYADLSFSMCLALPTCTAITCPDPSPYLQPHPKFPARVGPVCQARSPKSAKSWLEGESFEGGHGMCEPNGCLSLFLVHLTPSEVTLTFKEKLNALLSSTTGATSPSGTFLAFVGKDYSTPRKFMGMSDNPLGTLQVGGEEGLLSNDLTPTRKTELMEQLGVTLDGTPSLRIPPSTIKAPWEVSIFTP